jgi:hypothetical protein
MARPLRSEFPGRGGPAGHWREIAYHDTGQVASVTEVGSQRFAYTYDWDSTRKEYYVRREYSDGRVIESWFDRQGLLLREDINGETRERMVKDGARRRILTDRRGLETVRGD